MNPTNIVDDLIRDIKERLTLDGKNRVFEEGKELSSEFMKEKAEPEAFTKEFLIDKILDPLELEKLPEKSFETPKGHRSVDYRIKSKNGMFLVEAKPLNANLFDKSRDGSVNQIKGLFRLAEVKENYDFGVATDGLRWVFIDKNKEVVSDLNLEANHEQIHEFLVGKEKVISPKTEEEISKKFYDWYNALLHGGRYNDHENKQKTVSEADCLVNNIIGVKDRDEKEQIAQVVMNRLIFIKFLQSKGIIAEDILKYLSEIEEDLLTSKLKQLFFSVLNTPEDKRSDIDERFNDIPYLNGSLFIHTEVEFMRQNFDYKVRAEILKNVLEFLDSFKFVHKEHLGNGDSLDPEILGYIFERAMTATDRKGTGAYYTPKSITKYISENTIYPCIIEKTNEILKTEKGYKDAELIRDIEELFILPATTLKEVWEKIILKLRVLDNACGSGAFLLAAANILFGLNKKINDKIGAENPDTTLKILILVNNLYGVDINPNGIEIAKLRLWLWLADSYEPGYIKPLPNIDYNLRVGNSLIGYVDLSEFKSARLTLSDFLRDEEKPTLDSLLKEMNELIGEYKISWGEEAKELKESIQELDVKISNLLNSDLYQEFRERKIQISREEFLKLKPFHWGFEFYEVFALDKPQEERGFDVVIGNPPYVNAKKLVNLFKDEREYLNRSKKYETLYQKWDIYIPFIERSLKILKKNGLTSMIIPYPFVNQMYAKVLRRFILEKYNLVSICDLSPNKIFKDASVVNCIYVISNSKAVNKVDIYIINNNYKIYKSITKTYDELIQNKNTFVWNIKKEVKINIDIDSNKLGDICFISKGLVLNADEKKAKGQFQKKDLISNYQTEINNKRYIEAKDIDRYIINWIHWLEWDTERVPDLISRPTFPQLYETDKILINKIGNIKAALDNENIYCDQTIRIAVLWKNIKGIENRSINNSVKKFSKLSRNELEKISEKFNEKYLLAILNSNVSNYILNQIRGTGNIDINPEYLKNIPIPKLDFSNPEKVAKHDKLVALVDSMLELQKQYPDARMERDKEPYERQIKIVDTQIDSIVYELYELTPEEIVIVEESSK